MDKIIITDLHTMGIIGVKHPERDIPQEILINVTLYKDLKLAGSTDSIHDTINYSTIAKFLTSLVLESSFYTVEALASHLVSNLLDQFPAYAVRMKVEKTQVVKSAQRVGVEIFRKQHQKIT